MALSGDKEIIQHLCSAVQAGKLAEVDTTLQRGMYINVDESGNMVAKSLYRNLLMLAIDSLQAETAKLLIERGINLNHKIWGVNGKQGARDMASENGMEEIVDLIDSKLPVSKRLFFAVNDGNHEKVQHLIKHIDADMNMKVDVYGDKAAGCSAYTLLMIALKNGHVEISNMLIDKGITLDFDHQEWDRPDATSEPILVESYDARKLAMDMGMVGVAQTIDKRKMGVANGKTKTTIPNGVEIEHSATTNVEATTNINGTTNTAPDPITTQTATNDQPHVTKKDHSKVTGCTCVIC